MRSFLTARIRGALNGGMRNIANRRSRASSHDAAGLVRDLQIFPQGVYGQRRSDEIGQAQHQFFEAAEILDPLQCGDFLLHETRPVLPGPAPRLGLAGAEERFRETAKPQEFGETGSVADAGLGHREGMKPQEVVASL